MDHKFRGKLSVLCIAAGALFLFCALALCLWNLRESKGAEERAAAIVEGLRDNIPQPFPASLPVGSTSGLSGGEMTVFSVDGVDYIGILSLPSAGLELPVAADWSYEQLKNSPCRFSGTYFGGDLVICAHNYLRHFWPLLNLGIGEEIVFTAADGQMFRYLVSNRETLSPDEMERLTESGPDRDWDLTLFTCNLDGASRCVLRCARVGLKKRHE